MSDEKPQVSLGDMIQPLAGKVAVLVETKDEITAGGLYIPVETARSVHEDRPTRGVVVAVGDDVDEVEVGQTVIFGKYTGTKIKYQIDRSVSAETVIIMDERSILTVLLSPEEASNIKVRG